VSPDLALTTAAVLIGCALACALGFLFNPSR
jgi:hypothetical protein